ncbi:hypothetical protein Tco_1059135, partial [Tanacetum coccineum]
EPQSDPSPRPSHTPHIPDSIPEVSGGNQGGQSFSDRSLSGTEGGMILQSVYDLCISLCTQGRKSTKAEPSVHKDPLFDELDDDEIDNMDTEDAQDVGRTRNGVNAEKEGTEDAVSTEDVVLLNMSQAKAVSREKEKGVELKDVEETERPRPTSTEHIFAAC